ncbi:MAG: hypothetical protein ACO326_07095, partial [Burkholderiaceae bacterium]
MASLGNQTPHTLAKALLVEARAIYMVAVLAHRHSIPFYFACPFSTIGLRTPDATLSQLCYFPYERIADGRWRRDPESNRGRRLCRP